MNRLKELRLERNANIKDICDLLGVSHAALNYYEAETRDLNTKNLKLLSDYFNVSIDYLLCHKNDGIFVFYEKDNKYYSLDEKTFHDYKSQGLIYYKNNKRYLDMNKKLNISSQFNVSDLLEYLEEKNNMDSLFANEETINVQVPLKRIKAVEKIIKLDDEKFEAIKNMLKVL